MKDIFKAQKNYKLYGDSVPPDENLISFAVPFFGIIALTAIIFISAAWLAS